MRKLKTLLTVLVMGSAIAVACKSDDKKDNTGDGDGDGDGDGTGGGDGDGDGDGTGGVSGDGDGDGGAGSGGDSLGGMGGGMGGMGGTGGTADLAGACESRCAVTTTLECPGNEDVAACENECENGAFGCDAEWLAWKECDATLSASGFMCVDFGEFGAFIELSDEGGAACGDAQQAWFDCPG